MGIARGAIEMIMGRRRQAKWREMPVALCACLIFCSPAHAGDTGPNSGEVSADASFKALFNAWTGGDTASPRTSSISVPSQRPVESFRYTSPFGTRIDPFRGNSSFHSGIDLAAPVGTPVHASADAQVTRAEFASGYGNLVVLDHGGGIETRYGHLSRIVARPGQQVHRGDLIGLVGSTGRSTGSHLHYEVRLSSQPINPLAFMAPGDERLALNQAVGPNAGSAIAMGGPDQAARPDRTQASTGVRKSPAGDRRQDQR